MDTFTILLCLGIGLLLLGVWDSKSSNVWKHQYLKVLTYNWKDGEVIKIQVEEIIGKPIEDSKFYMNMLTLVEEHLVEQDFRPMNFQDYSDSRIYYRLVKDGGQESEGDPLQEFSPSIPIADGA